MVANQLARLVIFRGRATRNRWGPARRWAGDPGNSTGPDGRAGLHRYHSTELVTDLRCAQLPGGMLDGPGAGGSPAAGCTSCSTTTAVVTSV